jgi:hypothetical protein
MFSLIDKNLLKKFDVIIKYYCELLYKWGLYNKRVEMFEFLSEKPTDLDSKFGNYHFSFSEIKCMRNFAQIKIKNLKNSHILNKL